MSEETLGSAWGLNLHHMSFITVPAAFSVPNTFWGEKQLIIRKLSMLFKKKLPIPTEITTHSYQLNYENTVEKSHF